MIEGTDMNQIEKVARAIIGPHEPVPASSRYTLDELREVRWRQITSDERSMALREAKAAIAAMQPAPQEPVDSAAEITRLTEALRAAEERERALREALFNATALIGHSVPMDTTALVAGEQLTAQGVWLQGRDALAGAKP